MTHATLITPELLRQMPLRDPEEGGGKESRGRVLLVGGSRQVPGALLLAGEAALRAGAGKLQIATVESVAVPLALALPEARVIALPETRDGNVAGGALEVLRSYCAACAAVLFGPGMLDGHGAAALAAGLLAEAGHAPFVLDAIGLTGLRDRHDLLRQHGGRLVLTPHLGEMAALTGKKRDAIEADPLAAAREAAGSLQATLALKGATTEIVAPSGEAWHYKGAPFGIATAGSGDVLAGLIAGLLARGAPPAQAAVWGVALHAEAGKRVASTVGPMGFLARELLAEVPRVMAALGGKP